MISISRPALEVGLRFWSRLQLPKRRSYLQFAEEELVLTTGPRRGLRFRSDFMPWSRLVLEEYDRGRFRRFFLSGSVQSGKTLIAFVLPVLYHLFEMGESVIIGVPKIDMAQGIYDERILPVIQASRYAALIPTTGPGSRGGRITSAIRFLNGAVLRFMGAGGGDAQRSSHTARVVILTEIDKMDEAGEASREADPVTQIEKRSQSFGDQALLFGECTLSLESGRIYREVCEYGTDSRPLFRCPHCRRPVPLERSGFGGWQEAPDLPTARARAGYTCPSCSARWTEADRQAALREPLIVSKGQEWNSEAGTVSGELPATNTFGFRWTALASSLLSMADIAEDEYRADHGGNVADAKALAQFVWAEPYRAEIIDTARPRIETVLQKMTQHERGAIPEGTEKVTMGIDVGSYVVWWTLMAWSRDAQGHVVDFGGIDVPLQGGAKNPLAIMAALRAFRDNTIFPGWGGRRPDLVLVDSGYEQDVVYRWVVESGEGRFLACKGYGSSSRNGLWRAGVGQSATRQVGNDWRISVQPSGIRLVEIHSDVWKSAVHDGWAAAHGAPGSLTLFRGSASDPGLRVFARQIVAEQRELDPTPGKEIKIKWVVMSKQNHYLDCNAYARAAADILGIRLLRVSAPARPSSSPAAAKPPVPARRPVSSERRPLHRNY